MKVTLTELVSTPLWEAQAGVTIDLPDDMAEQLIAEGKATKPKPKAAKK